MGRRGGQFAGSRIANRSVTVDRAGRFLVRASSADFFGVRCGVQFDKGVGRTDNGLKAAELEGMGFTVSEEPACSAKMFCTGEEAKTRLALGEDEIRQLIREGRLHEFHDGACVLFKVEQVEWLRAEFANGQSSPAGDSGKETDIRGAIGGSDDPK
jgi:hypothetical protein